jgi:hypothetical protein
MFDDNLHFCACNVERWGVVWAYCGRETLCSTNLFSSYMGWSQTTKNLRTSCRLPSTRHRTHRLRPSDWVISFITSPAIHFFSICSSLIYVYVLAFLSHYFLSHLSVLSSFLPPHSFPPLTLSRIPTTLCLMLCQFFSQISASLLTAHK